MKPEKLTATLGLLSLAVASAAQNSNQGSPVIRRNSHLTASNEPLATNDANISPIQDPATRFADLKANPQCRKPTDETNQLVEEICGDISKALQKLAKDMHPSDITFIPSLLRALSLTIGNVVFSPLTPLGLLEPYKFELQETTNNGIDTAFEKLYSILNKSKFSQAFQDFSNTVLETVEKVLENERGKVSEAIQLNGHEHFNLMARHQYYGKMHPDVKKTLGEVYDGIAKIADLLGIVENDRPLGGLGLRYPASEINSIQILSGVLGLFEGMFSPKGQSNHEIKKDREQKIKVIADSVKDTLSQ